MLLDVLWNWRIELHGKTELAAKCKNQIEVKVVSVSLAKTKATRDTGIALCAC
jgi:hypothetical protein